MSLNVPICPFNNLVVLECEQNMKRPSGRNPVKAISIQKSRKHGRGIIMNPLPCFRSVVCFRVCGFSRYGIYSAPGTPALLIQLSLFLFGELLIRNKFLHADYLPKLWRNHTIKDGRLQEVNDHALQEGRVLRAMLVYRPIQASGGSQEGRSSCQKSRSTRARIRAVPT